MLENNFSSQRFHRLSAFLNVSEGGWLLLTVTSALVLKLAFIGLLHS